MVQAQAAQPETDSSASRHRPLALGLIVSVSALVSLCAKKAGQVSKKAGQVSKKLAHHRHDRCKFSPRSPAAAAMGSPLRRPKKLLSNISNKAIAFVHGRKKGTARGGEESEADSSEELCFGDGGVWQRSILMGDKCQPLNFSGVIYYDEEGKKLDQAPLRSPRASPLPGYLARARPEEGRVSKFDFGGLGK
ncbi:uncharacterized protein J3R85_018053 [Psidium guajava]|nr:uncharacterized protein J3R85_018053 [Psidium guajava]